MAKGGDRVKTRKRGRHVEGGEGYRVERKRAKMRVIGKRGREQGGQSHTSGQLLFS